MYYKLEHSDFVARRSHESDFVATQQILASFLQDAILDVKSGIVCASVGADEITQACVAALRSHKEAYGTKLLKPKHHWMMDLGPQVRRDQKVVDAFVVERQHLLVKSVSEAVKNTSDFEVSVLSSLVHAQIRSARNLKLSNGLLGQTTRLQELPAVTLSRKVTVYGFVIAEGDVVLRAHEVATVVACASEEATLFLFVAPMLVIGRPTEHSLKCRRRPGLAVWQALDVKQCTAWRDDPDGVLVLAR